MPYLDVVPTLRTILSASILIGASLAAEAPPGGTPQRALAFLGHGVQTGVGFPVGSPASLLQRFQTGNTGVIRTFTLPTSATGSIRIQVDDYHAVGARVSLTGRAEGDENSAFILKGDARSLYGWIVFPDRDLAYEYTTGSDGQLRAETVPVERIFPICRLHPPAGPDGGSVARETSGEAVDAEAPPMPVFADSLTPHIGPFPGDPIDVLKLQSLPGAEKVYFIDYEPQLAGGLSTPKGQTKQDVWETWQSLSAMFAPFRVNVTTDPAVYAAAGVANSGIANMRDVNGGTSMCGINTFGTRGACQVSRYTNGYSTGRILAHEVGHGMGLFHDGGDNGGEYFNGYTAYQWTPLMGNVWPGDRWTNALYQFSKGEYNTATQKQDDWALINKHLEFREDDIPGNRPLRLQGSAVPAMLNRGQIHRSTDVDSFTFRIASGGGQANLRIDRIEYKGGGMLDVEASIVDAAGKVVVRHNAQAARHALLSTALDAGAYTLIVRGGSEGSPPASGFTSYSSVGFYAIDGTLTSGVVGLADAVDRTFRVRSERGGMFSLELPAGARTGRIAVYTALGTPILETRNPSAGIDLSRFPAGLYVLRAEIDGQALVRILVHR